MQKHSNRSNVSGMELGRGKCMMYRFNLNTESETKIHSRTTKKNKVKHKPLICGSIGKLWEGHHLNQELDTFPCKGLDCRYFWLVSHSASVITNIISKVGTFAKRAFKFKVDKRSKTLSP